MQQYGPRLDKPYPFYDWVETAREEIRARGETPSPLRVEPAGAEHYFGHGINSSLPGRSPFGRPTRVLEMGTTQVPKEVWEEYLFEMMGAWSEWSLEALGPAFD